MDSRNLCPEPQTCSICLDALPGKDAPENAAMSLPCSHVFCTPCIKGWLRVAHTCPLCRRAVRVPRAVTCRPPAPLANSERSAVRGPRLLLSWNALDLRDSSPPSIETRVQMSILNGMFHALSPTQHRQRHGNSSFENLPNLYDSGSSADESDSSEIGERLVDFRDTNDAAESTSGPELHSHSTPGVFTISEELFDSVAQFLCQFSPEPQVGWSMPPEFSGAYVSPPTRVQRNDPIQFHDFIPPRPEEEEEEEEEYRPATDPLPMSDADLNQLLSDMYLGS